MRGHVRITQMMEPACCVGRKPMGHGLAAGGGKAGFRAHAQDFGTVAIGDDEAGVFWQKISVEIGINGPEKAVCPFQIALPFTVGHEIGTAGFAFDDPDVAFGAKGHHIDAQATGGDQFLDAGKAESGQVARHAAGQNLTGLKLFGVVKHHARNYEQ
jgi:hypothetical protein